MAVQTGVEFFDVLVRYEVALWNAIEAQLAQRGEVNLATLHALRAVSKYGGRARIQELSDEIGITVGAASKLVDRLERDGLAVRSPNPENRRSSLIRLSSAGEHALTAGLEVFEAAVTDTVGGNDLDALTHELRRLESRLATSGGVSVA